MADRGARSRWWVAVGGLVCLADAALPRGLFAQLLLVAAAFAVPVAALRAVREGRARETGWILLAVGSAMIAAGELADLVWRQTSGGTSSTTVDLAFLAAYTVQLAGLMTMLRAASATRHPLGWFDASALGIAVGTVVWGTLYGAIFRHGDVSLVDLLTRFGGAILDVALVVVALRLVLTWRGRDTGHGLLLGAFGVQVVVDSVAALWHGYRAGGRLDAVWGLGYVLAAAAFATRRRALPRPERPTRLADVEIRHTLVLQVAVTVILAAMVVVDAAGRVPTVDLVVWSVALVALLVITRTRVLGLLRLVGAASHSENQRRLGAMIAGSPDLFGLADRDGTLRYLSPSFGAVTGRSVDQLIGARFHRVLHDAFDGVDDLAVRLASLPAGERLDRECTARGCGDDGPRTFRLRVANELATPEVNGWVITAHDVSAQARLTAELRHQALHDELTGLPNRSLLHDRIGHGLDRMSRATGVQLSVVLLDLDDFKAINDSLGHGAGDDLLRAAARRLEQGVRQGDTVARLGGDEFAILLEETDAVEADEVAARALRSLALPIELGSTSLAVRASAGVVTVDHPTSATDLLRCADIAMYVAKQSGKGRAVRFEASMHQDAREQLELRMELELALERGELHLAFQPIVDIGTGTIRGAEALLRWQHPERGPISPAVFIPVAERSGLVREIGAWVLATACARAAAWDDPATYVSVNVAAPQLDEPGFVDQVLRTLSVARLDPRRLMLEITESMLVGDRRRTQGLIDRLRSCGIRVAIDDFGTGYSSLAYLREFAADVIKIDQSFVREIDERQDHRSLTQAIVTLAAGLGMSTIAEGVEHQREAEVVGSLGCRLAQGYLYGRPMPDDDFRALLSASGASRPSGGSAPGSHRR